jgi:SAM-dependent methyltransferase
MPTYSGDFYREFGPGARASAEVIVPLVMDVVQARSVIDIGCGIGEWLAVFKARGASILGVDGKYVDRRLLRIEETEFVAADLTKPLPDLGRFDLCVSLEVAEHLPAKAAKTFVVSLTRTAPVVLFSAALPNQGGVHHVNERWPWYWRNLFLMHGFVSLDPFRPVLWHNAAVEWWYRQNLFLCVEDGLVTCEPYANLPKAGPLQLVNEKILQQGSSLKGSLKNLLRILRRAGGLD